MLPPCPSWEYEKHPERYKVVQRTTDLLVRLRSGVLPRIPTANDSRDVHRDLFADLTPDGFPCFAGTYRGERTRCLVDYWVKVAGDPRVGFPPGVVPEAMRKLAGVVETLVAAVEKLPQSDEPERRVRAVETACIVFDAFLRIHPYANGNGHAARFIVWAILLHFGYVPVRWSVEPRPDVANYTEMIVKHRNGERGPLVRHILACIEAAA